MVRDKIFSLMGIIIKVNIFMEQPVATVSTNGLMEISILVSLKKE